MQNFLNLRETAERLGVHSVTINRYCKQGLITYYQVGARKRFLSADIDKFLEGAKCEAQANKDPFSVSGSE